MKKCILYDDRVCNDCGECLVCDLDPNKLCDNCGKCISGDDEQEFLSMIVHAEEEESVHDDIIPLSEEDIAGLSDEEKQLLAFIDAPIDLNIPEPLDIDKALYEKWERILAEDAESKHRGHDEAEVKFKKAPASYAIRTRRRK
ncbi:MAG: hypothetical protein IKZ82_13155 [Clostridia bacterium]|nr:hypothetical protein [Clostridia bacterium]